MDGLRRVAFQFLAQISNVRIHRACSKLISITPNRIEKFWARNNAFRVLNHERQDIEFSRRESNRKPVPNEFHVSEVKTNISEDKDLFYGESSIEQQWSSLFNEPHIFLAN
jgi:hypothetical protein